MTWDFPSSSTTWESSTFVNFWLTAGTTYDLDVEAFKEIWTKPKGCGTLMHVNGVCPPELQGPGSNPRKASLRLVA